MAALRLIGLLLITFIIIPGNDIKAELNQVWWGFSLDLPVTKKLEMGYSKEIRSDIYEDIIDSDVNDLSIKYRFFDLIQPRITYRFKFKPKEIQQSWYFDLSSEIKFGKFEIDNRLRYSSTDNETKSDKKYLREKIALGYKFDKLLNPFTDFEIFYKIDSEDSEFDNLRFRIGFNTEIIKDQRLKIYYMYETEINSKSPEFINVIGISYSIEVQRIFG
jgi:hypothetical protein